MKPEALTKRFMMISDLKNLWAPHSKQYRSFERTLQYYYHPASGNPAGGFQELHGDSTQSFLLKNLYCLECMVYIKNISSADSHNTSGSVLASAVSTFF